MKQFIKLKFIHAITWGMIICYHLLTLLDEDFIADELDI